MLWNYCRGIDDRAIDAVQEAKSIGAEVNWGVRFNDNTDCENFLVNLSKEVSIRLQERGVEGRTITLKVKKRRKGAKEPAKFMGHGDCESLSRSATLPLGTDDMVLLERIAKQIFASLNIDVRDVRGVGMQISKLETVDFSKRGREKNALESWLTSYGKTSKKEKEIISSHNLSDNKETKVPERNVNCRTQQDDAKCQPSFLNENSSSGPSHVNNSHENQTSLLPELGDLDIDVIKNLPPEIFSEMNDMYNGKLSDFIKTYAEKENKTNANFIEASPNTKDKGKRPLYSPTVPVLDYQLESEVAQSALGNPSDSLEKFPSSSKTATIKIPRTNLWLGKPPKWVEIFRVSNCLLLNVVADMYFKSGESCNLSSVLQSLFSWHPPNLDLTSEDWDESLSSMCDLLLQYIDLKIDSDIEELYICFRLLKRFVSTSHFLLEVYNIVAPQLQVFVNERYGGQLQLDA